MARQLVDSRSNELEPFTLVSEVALLGEHHCPQPRLSAAQTSGLLDAPACPGYPVGLLKELGELVRLHLCEAHKDELG